MATTEKQETISIKLPDTRAVVKLQRCTDEFYRRAARFGTPINLHPGPWICTSLVQRDFGLPELYAALTAITGPTGEIYDSYKGSFAFPFKMTVRHDERVFKYLLHLMNFRSMVEPKVYRLDKNTEDAAFRSFHEPFVEELTIDDIAYVLSFLVGYLKGYSRTMPKWTTPFVLEVQSNGILFGYDPRSGKFFEEQYDTKEEYDAALVRWREVIPDHEGVQGGAWDHIEENW